MSVGTALFAQCRQFSKNKKNGLVSVLFMYTSLCKSGKSKSSHEFRAKESAKVESACSNNCYDRYEDKNKESAEVRTSVVLNVAILCKECVEEPNDPTYYRNSVEEEEANVTPSSDGLCTVIVILHFTFSFVFLLPPPQS